MAVTRTCLSVAFLAVALPAAAQHTCAELGPRNSGNRARPMK
jgi:hypothetical protein